MVNKKLIELLINAEDSAEAVRLYGKYTYVDLMSIEADYLTSHGVTILPCKMGDEVWGIKSFNNGGKRVKKGIVHQMFYGENMKLCIAVKGVCRGVWNEKVFASEEDARRALEEQNAI